MQISLRGIANRAKRLKDYRFLNLSTMLNEYNLLDSWQYVKKNVAYGVDKVSAREIERDLQSQVGSLVERLKRKSYRAKLVRRPRITQQRNYQLNFQRALCWCGSEYCWRARCGKTARRDLYGGRRVTGVPTVTTLEGWTMKGEGWTLERWAKNYKGWKNASKKLEMSEWEIISAKKKADRLSSIILLNKKFGWLQNVFNILQVRNYL